MDAEPEGAGGAGGRREPASGPVVRIERAALTALLLGMVGLASLQIALRNLFDTGLSWADPLLRAGVLWIGLIGAVAASRVDKQIRVDALPLGLPPRARAATHAATSLVTAAAAGVVAWHAGRFVIDERAFGAVAFAEVPAWTLQIVIPLAFGAMALHHARHGLASLAALRRRPVRPAGESGGGSPGDAGPGPGA